MGFIDKLLGNTSESRVKKLMPQVRRINELEPELHALSDEALRAKTMEFKERLGAGETLDGLLPEAFAVVREAAQRTIGQRHFDVQLLGGIVLHQGRIAEMKTGEGKTITETLPAYLNALTGHGVHIVTVNDYLAKRDAQWMGKIYRFLGLTVGCIVHELDNDARRKAYACDITYGTNNEFGFDYLRDNMVVYKEQMVQRELNYAIVDEVDSILIDEARTPLIISGQGEKSTDLYVKADRFVRRLERGANIEKLSKTEILMGEEQPESGDYMADIKARTVALTQQGLRKAEQFFGIDDISDSENTELNHHILQALKAHALFQRDKDYVVQDGQVLIVDEFTGRLMLGRRYSDGLHQALEAKENVKVERENKTLATITFQNYFRMFKKLAGMTGTAKTEEAEFQSIYDLDVVEIPTNKPLARKDYNDVVYTTEAGKFKAVVEEIASVNKTGQPILVGTISVEKSELVSAMLSRRGIKHEVLNAKMHAKEAEIVAQAGKFGNVTIATNMAGRGTDILLGGNPEFLARRELRQNGIDEALIEEATGHAETEDADVLAARQAYNEAYAKHKKVTDAEHDRVVAVGGLHIIGTERHESRRIDNQLRGRAGRQGDPGESKFYLSLEDDLMRLFGSERMISIYNALGIPEGEEIQHKTISKTIEKAQKKIENNNFGIRKNLLDYDRVNNEQREVMYKERRRVLDGDDMKESVLGMMKETVANHVYQVISDELPPEEWDLAALNAELLPIVPLNKIVLTDAEKSSGRVDDLVARLQEETVALYEQKEKEFEDFDLREIERIILLKVIDRKWMDHIDDMDQLREGIGLQAYGQRDPVVEYRMAGFEMFNDMTKAIQEETTGALFHVQVEQKIEREEAPKITGTNKDAEVEKKPYVRKGAKVGRNDPCPCGSGKKYKNCCGRNK